MAKITNILQNSRISIDNTITSKNIQKRFGKAEDNIELYILDIGNNIVFFEEDFTEYLPENINEGLFSEFNMDPVTLLRSKGFTVGKYKIVLNIHKKKIFNDFSKNFKITEISPSRREIRTVGQNIPEERLEVLIRNFIRDLENSVLFKDYALNFGNNRISTAINIKINKRGRSLEILFKLFEPLPSSISKNDTFRIVEEITDPISLNVDMGTPEELDRTEQLQGPNFKIDVRLNNSVPSTFKTYNDVLNYNLTSSYQNLLNQLENREIPEIQYDFIRPISASIDSLEIPYHFENFVHFSSATERLKNFEYKLKLIENYNSDLQNINDITGGTTGSSFVLVAKDDINSKIEKLIKGFDGYEQFLYFTSGSDYTWPKLNSTYPYTLYSISSSQAISWLGEERSGFPNYGGQLLSASLYDRQNEYGLTNLVPNHIVDNPDNNFYQTFVNMVGHHFDLIWTYIRAITDVNNTDNNRGISKDLVYLQLKSLGIETFDQFENSNLIEYILGHAQSGSSTFYTAPTNQTLVTASNEGSIAKGDITKEIWKRLYHNAPYLLKTKGTERGIKALMSCYGIPSTVLNVKEYAGSTPVGGPLKDIKLSDKFKTFSYDKSSLAFKSRSDGGSGSILNIPWAGGTSNVSFGISSSMTLELRVKPDRITTQNVKIFEFNTGLGVGQTINLELEASSSGIDSNESGDNTKFGRLILKSGATEVSQSNYFPLYNGDFWNIHLSCNTASVHTFGAYQSNFNKNIFIATGSSKTPITNTFVNTWQSKQRLMVGTNGFSGSVQEFRGYIGEKLTNDTHIKHALEPFMMAGNTVSSSFVTIKYRYPLGSNNIETTENHTPNPSIIHYAGSTNVNRAVTGSNQFVEWEEITQKHFHPTPDTVGISTTSEKVRTDTGVIDNDILSVKVKSETSTLDRQPPDYEDLGVFFSPTTEINEDIVYQLGSFRLDDVIGSPLPSVQTSSKYEDLTTLKNQYFKGAKETALFQNTRLLNARIQKRFNYWDYIKTIQYIDHTLFKLVEQFVPAKANLKTGLLIEPHYLERSKFARELPVINYGTTMNQGSYQTIEGQVDPEKSIHLQSSSFVTLNTASIDLDDYVLDEVQNIAQTPITPVTGVKNSNVLLGNVIKGKLSNKYYRKLIDGKETDY